MRLFAVFTFLLAGMAYGGRMPDELRQRAPELSGNQWLNAPEGAVSLASRKGQVTVVHFWTYGCINCKRNLPVYARWHEQFGPRGVAVIGIHTPEFEQEARLDNVAAKVQAFGIGWPVLLDPKMDNWRRWKQQFWPAVYLIDRQGVIRYRWDGELNYGGIAGESLMNAAIERLLAEQPKD